MGVRGVPDPDHAAPSSRGTGPIDLDALIEITLQATSARLHFSSGTVSNDPVKLTPGSPANCIGYAALFKALLEEQLAGAGGTDAFRVEQVIGQLHVGGWNVHTAFNSPFWKDHDIVRITERSTGTRVHVDPTLHDVMGIGRVTGPLEPLR